MQSAEPIIMHSLHDLTTILAVILAFVVAGTVGYFYAAAHVNLEQ